MEKMGKSNTIINMNLFFFPFKDYALIPWQP